MKRAVTSFYGVEERRISFEHLRFKTPILPGLLTEQGELVRSVDGEAKLHGVMCEGDVDECAAAQGGLCALASEKAFARRKVFKKLLDAYDGASLKTCRL